MSAMGNPEDMIIDIMKVIEKYFRTFGGGRVSNPDNPIAQAAKDEPLQFAAGENVRDVVEVVAGLTLHHINERLKNTVGKALDDIQSE